MQLEVQKPISQFHNIIILPNPRIKLMLPDVQNRSSSHIQFSNFDKLLCASHQVDIFTYYWFLIQRMFQVNMSFTM